MVELIYQRKYMRKEILFPQWIRFQPKGVFYEKYRLTRFGFNYLERICNHHGVRIIVVKDIDKTKSIEQELAEDLMSLIASFSGKLYGLRSKGNVTVGKD